MSPTVPLQLVLFSKPGCHLCEGLQEKLEAIQQSTPCPLDFKLDIRDITTRTDWFDAYQYEIPVLYWALLEDMPSEPPSEPSLNQALDQAITAPSPSPDSSGPTLRLITIPRPSPRASVNNVLKILKSSLP